MANAWYNQAKGRLLNGDLILSSDTIKAALILTTPSYTFNADDDAPSSWVSSEAAGGSYARQTLGTKSGTVDDSNDLGYWSCGTITFTAVPVQAGTSTIKALIIYEYVTNDTDSRNIAYFDTGTGFPLTPNGGDITVTIAAGGLLKIT